MRISVSWVLLIVGLALIVFDKTLAARVVYYVPRLLPYMVQLEDGFSKLGIGLATGIIVIYSLERISERAIIHELTSSLGNTVAGILKPYEEQSNEYLKSIAENVTLGLRRALEPLSLKC
jgi:hypothetical protein